jgi:hypothetical protein
VRGRYGHNAVTHVQYIRITLSLVIQLSLLILYCFLSEYVIFYVVLQSFASL